MISPKLCVVLCLVIHFVTPQELFIGNRLWDAAKNDGAKCLDGSEPHYFYRDGTASTKWFIFYEGGGWCTLDGALVSNAFDACSYRRDTYMGSTRYDTQTLDLQRDYFSQDPAKNPLMSTWNMVYIRYCDGSSFTSDRTDTIGSGAKKMYFRGARIRKAVADDLFANKNLKGATEVVIGGCSAGGLAANIALDWWKQQFDQLSSPPRVTGLLDSSFFLEINYNGCHYKDGLRKLVADMNSSHALNENCRAAFPGNEWECMFAQQMDKYVTTSMFALQPKFDDWQLWAEACSTDATVLNDYGTMELTLFKNDFIGSHSNRGAFVDSCRHHCWKYDDLTVQGVTNAQAFKDWYNGKYLSPFWIDSQAYQCVSCCSV